MNLKNLFAAQKVLRDRIDYNEPDRFNKLILALLVELGECANEQRSWKYWSTDQEPRTEVLIECDQCGGSGRNYVSYCGNCHGGYVGKENPLLEEYVDGFHFVLELGIEWGLQGEKPFLVHLEKVEKMFLKNYKLAIMLIQCGQSHKSFYYGELLSNYLGLGKALGFTWEQIEQAYYAKHAINLQRQDDGY